MEIEDIVFYVIIILISLVLLVAAINVINVNLGVKEMKDYKITNTYQCEFCKDFYNIQDMKEIYVNSKCYDACRNCSGFMQTVVEKWLGKVAEK